MVLLSAAAQAAKGASPPHKNAALTRQHHCVGAPAGCLQHLSACGLLLMTSHYMEIYATSLIAMSSSHRESMNKQGEQRRLSDVRNTGQVPDLSGHQTFLISLPAQF